MKTRCRGEYYPPSHLFLIPKIKLLEREQKSYRALFSIDFGAQSICELIQLSKRECLCTTGPPRSSPRRPTTGRSQARAAWGRLSRSSKRRTSRKTLFRWNHKRMFSQNLMFSLTISNDHCQCSLWALEKDLEGSTLVVGGDGRFFMAECTEIIIRWTIIIIFATVVGKWSFSQKVYLFW